MTRGELNDLGFFGGERDGENEDIFYLFNFRSLWNQYGGVGNRILCSAEYCSESLVSQCRFMTSHLYDGTDKRHVNDFVDVVRMRYRC